MKKNFTHEVFIPHKGKFFFFIFCLPWYARYSITIACCTGMVIIWSFAYYYPAKHSIQKIHEEICSLTHCINQGKHTQTKLIGLQKEYDTMHVDNRNKITTISEKYYIENMERCRLSLVSLEPLIIQNEKSAIHGIHIVFNGSYHNIMNFLISCKPLLCEKINMEKQYDEIQVSCTFHELTI